MRSLVMKILALVFRVLAACYVVCTLILFVSRLAQILHLGPFVSLLASLIPRPLFGLWVTPSPLDGTFRADFAIFSMILLVFDCLFSFAAKRMKSSQYSSGAVSSASRARVSQRSRPRRLTHRQSQSQTRGR